VRYTFAGFLVLLLVSLLFGSVDVAAAGAAGIVLVLLIGGVSVAAFVDHRGLRQARRSRD
jgi:MFS-type transporter involved in bile tolerance (Atg22 family)